MGGGPIRNTLELEIATHRKETWMKLEKRDPEAGIPLLQELLTKTPPGSCGL